MNKTGSVREALRSRGEIPNYGRSKVRNVGSPEVTMSDRSVVTDFGSRVVSEPGAAMRTEVF